MSASLLCRSTLDLLAGRFLQLLLTNSRPNSACPGAVDCSRQVSISSLSQLCQTTGQNLSWLVSTVSRFPRFIRSGQRSLSGFLMERTNFRCPPCPHWILLAGSVVHVTINTNCHPNTRYVSGCSPSSHLECHGGAPLSSYLGRHGSTPRSSYHPKPR